MSFDGNSAKIETDQLTELIHNSTQHPTGTHIFHQVAQFCQFDPERGPTLHAYWASTPWIVNARVSRHRRDIDTDLDRTGQLIAWCHAHVPNGEWQESSVTLYGWAWFGFAFKHQLAAFEKFLESLEMFALAEVRTEADCVEPLQA